jgi:membrane associated rhomboid family serine protease
MSQQPQTTVQFGLPRFTPGVKRLMIANAALWFVGFLIFFFGRMSERADAYDRVLGHLMLQPDDWRAFFAGLPVWQLATYGFLHSPLGVGHVLMNMLTLYFFGTLLESAVGTRRFTLTYLMAMLSGAVLYLVPALLLGGAWSNPVLGASGACLGVMIAAATLRPRATVLFLFIPMTLRTLALIVVAIDVFNFMATLAMNASDGVAHLVHLGGMAYGFLAVRTGLISLDPVRYIERRRAVAEVERAASDEQRMDQLLEKIHREGMTSLSHSEREFLKRMSARR